MLLTAVLVVGVGLLIFGQAGSFSFLDYDDPVMVTGNGVVQQGLSAESLSYAFRDTSTNLYHPLTWLSHMVDVELFGEWAGGPHLVNVLLHLASSVLVLLLLSALTGRVTLSAIVALLFAIHPMHVESVAWVSERKDVLSTFFYLLTVLAYVHWTRSKRWPLYAAAVAACLAGFLSKPSLITLPFALLLVDFWPLGRITWNGFAPTAKAVMRRSLEKAPFFLMAAAFAVLAWKIETSGTHAGMAELTTFPERLGVTSLGYLSYLARTFWPSGLAPFYPHPESLSPGLVALGWTLLLGGVVAGLVLHKRVPWLLFGWLWFVGLLLPASGIVTISDAFAPDRYSYLAHLGLFVVLVWGAAALVQRARLPRAIPVAASAAALGVLAVMAFLQTAKWKTSESLWSHTLAVTGRNYFAHNKLAILHLRAGCEEDGLAHLRAAVAAKPDFAFAHANLGRVLHRRGALGEAITHYAAAIAVKPTDVGMRRAVIMALEETRRFEECIPHLQALVEREPEDAQSRFKLANLLFATGEKDRALFHYEAATALKPGDALIRGNLGAALVEAGEIERAVHHLEAALEDEKNPMLARVHYFLAKAQRAQGALEDAVTHYEEALRRAPKRLEIFDEFAWLLATSEAAAVRDGHRAVTLALHANKKSRDPNPHYLMTLGAAYAEAGEFQRAVEATRFAERFLEDPAAGLSPEEISALGRKLAAHRTLYSANRPVRDTNPIPKPKVARR